MLRSPGGLTTVELLKCTGFKEILKPNKSLFAGKIESKRWGIFEIEMIKTHKNISIQSEWIRAYISSINNSKIFETGMILREKFTNSLNPILYTSSLGATAYKGLRILFKALSILKKNYPNVILKIAGSHLNGIKRIN